MNPGEQWSDLFDRAPCGLLSTTANGLVTTVNDTFLRMVGAGRDEVVGHYLIERLSRGSTLYFESRFMPQLTERGRASEVAFDLLRPDAGTLSVFVNAVVDTGNVGGAIRFAVFDATVRRHYERELLVARRDAERSETRVRILQAATTEFGTSGSDAELARVLAEAACSATDAAVVSVHLREESGVPGHPVSVGTASPVAERALLDALAAGDEVASTITCADPAELGARFPAIADDLRAGRFEALAVVPLRDDGETVGLLLIGFGRPRHLDAATVHLLESLVEQSVLVRQRIRLQELVSFQSLHDALTGMPNRLSLQRRLDQLLAESQASRLAIALLFIDLDGFKAVNDRLGHQGGDRVLQQIGRRLGGVVRSEDMVGRLGGDEFLLICQNVDDESLVEIAERLRSAVRHPPVAEAVDLPLSASVGVSVYVPGALRDDVTGEVLIRLADEAMYESKRAGKDRSTFVQV